MADYDKQLLRESVDHPLTADRIGELVGCYGPDAVTRLRNRKDLRVSVVSIGVGSNHRKRLYRVYHAPPIRGPYCCGYCERQRQLDAKSFKASTTKAEG